MTPADLQRLQSATGRFIKLPDAGWLELDAAAVQSAHEAMADLGVDGLIPVGQRLSLAQAAHLDEAGLQKFGDTAQAKMLRQSLAEFRGVPATPLPEGIQRRVASLSAGGIRFPLPSQPPSVGRNSGRRHGPGKNAANPGLAGLDARQHRASRSPPW